MSNLHIAVHFNIQGSPVSISSFGSGHINDTYILKTDQVQGPDYLLQRINHHVFKDIPLLMHNILLVTDHLRRKYADQGLDVNQCVLTPIATTQGTYYYKENGHYWRMFTRIRGTKSYDIVHTEQQAGEGGRAFGRFQAMLSDLNADKLGEVIPNFCHIGYRLNNFHAALQADVSGRRSEVQREVDFLESRQGRMCRILEMAERGELPLRITHNDTKFNNVLLDQQDRAQCVIDLDTVMPGYVAYDFGDAIRTIINRGAEDARDLDTVQLNLPLFRAYTKGYFEEAHVFLNEKEVYSLIEGTLLFPYMQAVRFLTDYLQGDQYYKIQYSTHNLQRTKAQIKLLQEIEKHQQELDASIHQLAATYNLIPVH